MTPAQIIDEVLVELSRPDLRRKAEAVFVEVVKSAHKINNLVRDLKYGYVLDPSVLNNRITFPVRDTLPGYRSIRGVQLFKSYTLDVEGNVVVGEELIPHTAFVRSDSKLEVKDYYGFKNPFVYSIVGDLGTVTGIDSNVACVAIEYLGYPTIAVDEITMGLVTDSWIVEDYPELIKAFLTWRLALRLDAPEIINSAERHLTQMKIEFIDQYLNDILPET